MVVMARPMNGRTQHRGRGCKDERRAEGEARNAEWRKLSVDEQVRSLIGRRGESKKQLKRLQGD
jgi:hypothetical protein